jgi:hypothetical protein
MAVFALTSHTLSGQSLRWDDVNGSWQLTGQSRWHESPCTDMRVHALIRQSLRQHDSCNGGPCANMVLPAILWHSVHDNQCTGKTLNALTWESRQWQGIPRNSKAAFVMSVHATDMSVHELPCQHMHWNGSPWTDTGNHVQSMLCYGSPCTEIVVHELTRETTCSPCFVTAVHALKW